MINPSPSRALLALLVFGNGMALAQDIDFDDITMTVVAQGMFEARQLERPDSDRIREAMNSGIDVAPNDSEGVPTGKALETERDPDVSQSNKAEQAVRERQAAQVLQERPAALVVQAVADAVGRDERTVIRADSRDRVQRDSLRERNNAPPVATNHRE